MEIGILILLYSLVAINFVDAIGMTGSVAKQLCSWLLFCIVLAAAVINTRRFIGRHDA